MKAIFDCRFIRIEHHDGISRFSSELFTAVSKHVELTALISDLRQLQFLPEGTSYILGNDPTNALAELGLARRLNSLGATHVFSPMQTMGSLGRKYKLILTLHDLIYYSHPKAPPALPLPVRIAWRIYHLNFWAARLLLNRCDAVVTVSETSKRLIEQNRLTTKPVHVIYNAPDSTTTHLIDGEQKTMQDRKQLVYMGSFMGYKNVECLVVAMKHLPDHELVLLSKISPTRKAELTALAGAAGNRVIFRNGVTDLDYAKTLKSSFALVSASKDEGFGIPLVEAMAHGIPVVVSDNPIFREIAAQAGRYFDPMSPASFVAAVTELSKPGQWEAASAESLIRSRTFDWDESARVLIRALESI